MYRDPYTIIWNAAQYRSNETRYALSGAQSASSLRNLTTETTGDDDEATVQRAKTVVPEASAPTPEPPSPILVPLVLEDLHIERNSLRCLGRALVITRGNLREAARLVGLSRGTVYRMLQHDGLKELLQTGRGLAATDEAEAYRRVETITLAHFRGTDGAQ